MDQAAFLRLLDEMRLRPLMFGGSHDREAIALAALFCVWTLRRGRGQLQHACREWTAYRMKLHPEHYAILTLADPPSADVPAAARFIKQTAVALPRLLGELQKLWEAVTMSTLDARTPESADEASDPLYWLTGEMLRVGGAREWIGLGLDQVENSIYWTMWFWGRLRLGPDESRRIHRLYGEHVRGMGGVSSDTLGRLCLAGTGGEAFRPRLEASQRAAADEQVSRWIGVVQQEVQG